MPIWHSKTARRGGSRSDPLDIWHQQSWLKYRSRAGSGTRTQQGPSLTVLWGLVLLKFVFTVIQSPSSGRRDREGPQVEHSWVAQVNDIQDMHVLIIPVEEGIEWVSHLLRALLNCSISIIALSLGSVLSVKRVGDFPGPRSRKALMVFNLRLQVGRRASDPRYFPLPNSGAALLRLGDSQEAASGVGRCSSWRNPFWELSAQHGHASVLLWVWSQVTCQRSHKEAGSSLDHVSL